MSTTAEKLRRLLEIKEEIREALKTRLGYDPGPVMSAYAPLILSIHEGGTVTSVNNITPDARGNVQLYPIDIGVETTEEPEIIGILVDKKPGQ